MDTRRSKLSPDDETFFRQFVFPEEDRRAITSAPWRGEFRWFRSPNVIPLERYWHRLQSPDAKYQRR